MLEAVPLIAVTVFFISIFLYAYANLQLEEIRANWDERRCEALVMLLANMVPTDPSIDTSTFASENFQFCIGKIIDSSLSIMLQPMMASFSTQIDATKPISNAMNNLKKSAFSLLTPLLSIFGGMWGKLKLASFEIFRVYYNIHTAMDRVFGIAAASLFAGMGIFNAIKSAMGFVLQVIIAILIVLCILVIFLFFVMWPVIPIILTMIGILSATVYSANVSGMSESFCVGPDTLVKVAKVGSNGIWKKISEIRPGDALAEGVVEGVLRVGTPAPGTCVSIENVIISKSHLVFHNGWISSTGGHGTNNNWRVTTDQNNLGRQNGTTYGTSGAGSPSYAQICINDSGYESSECQIAELIVYNTTLSGGDYAAVESYLTGKYGV